MPRYFFHVRDGEDYTDLQGTMLPDFNAATKEASRFAAALLSENSNRFWNKDDWTISIEDEAKKTVAELRFSGRVNVIDPHCG